MDNIENKDRNTYQNCFDFFKVLKKLYDKNVCWTDKDYLKMYCLRGFL